ncbi:Glutathione synthase/Ribosomal protein S6 modification enzyme (glutaminyl transferase)-like protein [Desulfofarcimen acetoxidans DSM 771]|uniref:Glutathione synthase/Ribosomal protein S6 modification enzyme (Glutaminyl transferase)-like protein n=1 Tax=Desulfofarcimen acetoxidans (strain ATCC 49208 / DSM 771 / KCTC 5769 / VKM B-1644 / 5575) TaxID=485916 RepID=C8W383_DESAS|nr:YheC/YheD family protein [Desulfofarcimen acetoxidans]ACV61850.1 Glutathione synthase/Ribosomal protein S6 modification enzyme (glutaminyl transferase)-like protein [Desulfofarcimen acetoxidans DSM 771]
MTWIKLQGVNRDQEKSFFLPGVVVRDMPEKVKIRFGMRETIVSPSFLPGFVKSQNNSFHNPLPVSCSRSVIDDLLIQDGLTYQMLLSGDTISIGPVIGFLLGEQHYCYHDSHLKELTDALQVYERVGGLFCAFRYFSIDWSTNYVYGLFFDWTGKAWKYGKLPLPSVVFRRGFHKNGEEFKRLTEQAGVKLFNSSRLDKWKMHTKLKSNQNFYRHLPDTARLTSPQILLSYLKKYCQVILKPVDLSRGRGVCVINEAGDESIELSGCNYYDINSQKSTRISKQSIKSFLQRYKLLERNYIVQPYLKLARINGCPFDIRIVMQKNAREKWVCTGIECRLAGPGQYLTNISLGGRALPIALAAELAFGPSISPVLFKKEVISIGSQFCGLMEEPGEHYAEFGIDLAVDTSRRFWFLEANVRPSFKGFQVMDYENYLHICATPIFYAVTAAGFGKNKASRRLE